MDRPPFFPYVTADSLAARPWLPTDEPHARALEKWMGAQKGFIRYTGSQDLSIGQYALYRMRFTPAGDLADAWGDFGGLKGQLNHLANVLELSITDHAGVSVTYDHRIHQMMQKAALKRSGNTDYFSCLGTLNADVKAAVIRDFDVRIDTIKKEKEKANGGARIKRRKRRIGRRNGEEER